MLRTCPGKLPGIGNGMRLGLGAGADSSLGLALGPSISRELGDLEQGPAPRAGSAVPAPTLS